MSNKLADALRAILQSADSTGCTDDLTVVSRSACEAAEELLDRRQNAETWALQQIAEAWALLGKPYMDSYATLVDAMKDVAKRLKAAENPPDYHAGWRSAIKTVECLNRASDIRLPGGKLPTGVDAAPTDAPVDATGEGRLLLNEYGRQCWEAGHAAALHSVQSKDAHNYKRTVESLSTMLDWENAPPRHILEAEIRALKAIREDAAAMRQILTEITDYFYMEGKEIDAIERARSFRVGGK